MNKTKICNILFAICGIASTLIFMIPDFIRGIGEVSFFSIMILPGLLFILVTYVSFSKLQISFNFQNGLKYFFSTFILYCIIFYGTFFSGTGAIFVGILTGGLGALYLFKFVYQYIVKINYNKFEVFITGSASFILGIILILIFQTLDLEVLTKFSPTFFIWQTLVGNLLIQRISLKSS